jgi:hypothetical protein
MGLGPVLDYWRGRASKATPKVRDWTQAELSQFYRVEWALGQAGISVETDRGLSDEGDPWFAFCRASDSEVVIHIAREGDGYLLAGFLSETIQRGRDFGHLVERLLATHPARSIDKRGDGNVIMHPATLLALLVSIAFLQANEGKAETQPDTADESDGLRGPAPLINSQTIALRSGAAASTAAVALAATLELAQAMTILRVANLMDQPSGEEVSSDRPGALPQHVLKASWATHDKRASISEAAVTEHHHNSEVHAASAFDVPSTTLPQSNSIEKLLEVVAKLWTFPGSVPEIPDSLTVPAALAFFGAGSFGSDEMVSAPRSNHEARAQAHAQAQAGQAAARSEGDVKPVSADHAEPAASVTIVHSSGTSDSTAQTILKLTVGDRDAVTIKGADIADAGKLVAVVSELVAHAKSDLAVSLDTITVLAQADLDARPLAGSTLADKVSFGSLTLASDSALDSDAVAVGEKVPVEENYTTFVSDGAIKHEVLNRAGEASVERAIAAFKEDVDQFKIAVSGKDVIFYSPDAVINHTSSVVVELWQFKDGSSIALVGLSVDGSLPYSL